MNNVKKHRISSSVTIVVVIALVIVANIFVSVLNSKFPVKIDLTSNKMYELSDRTKEYLTSYDTPVNIYILASETEQDDNIRAVLEKYVAECKNIKLSNINVSANPTFGKKYITDGNALEANSVIVEAGDRFKVYKMNELYGVNAQTEQYTSLNVENKITSALKYVSSTTQLKAYITKGHNEMDIAGAKEKLTSENYEAVEINTLTEEIPSDASLLIIARPTADFAEDEITKIDKYLENGGDVQAYFDVESQGLTNLYKYLKSWGLGINDNVAVETDTSNSVTLSGSALSLVVPEVKSSEFTDSIIKNKRTLAYFPYSKSITQEFEVNGNLSVIPLLTTSDDAYTTTNYEDVTKTGSEPTGKFIVGALALDAKHGSSVYVSGNTMLLSIEPSTITNNFGLANYDYFMNLTNFTIGGDENFTVDEKTLIDNVISISDSGKMMVLVVVVILIPLVILITGLIIWIRRRNL